MRDSTSAPARGPAPPHAALPARRAQRAAIALRDRVVPPTARGIELAMALGAFALLPIWPFVAAAVACDRAYAARYFRTLVQLTRHIRGAARGRSVSRWIVQKLVPRHLDPEEVSGGCTHCGNCCLYGGCVYLHYDAQGRSTCRIYGGRVWKMLSCGEYPTSAREIALYDCPSFNAAPASGVRPRVIPIVAARPQPAAQPMRAVSRSRARK
jgi:hypothetical protein